MTTLFFIIVFFLFGYVLNMFYISILYHRALTHKSISLGPKMTAWLGLSGSWFTGLDPKTWACMHRLHHMHADAEKDPHSPAHLGVIGVWAGQYKAYLTIQENLIKGDQELNKLVADIPFDVSILNKKNLSWLPYIFHGLVAFLLSSTFHSSFIGIAYFLGMMSHPVQGWMVNALAHRFGSRNFDTADQSTNNMFVGLFVFGEGYQNNHHHFPKRAKFSVKWNEIDPGYGLCVMAEWMGLLKINRGPTA
jgi:stearoyl-CoA desaturase (delta-9 desaturase)